MTDSDIISTKRRSELLHEHNDLCMEEALHIHTIKIGINYANGLPKKWEILNEKLQQVKKECACIILLLSNDMKKEDEEIVCACIEQKKELSKETYTLYHKSSYFIYKYRWKIGCV